MWRQTWAEVDVSRLAHNVRVLKRRLAPGVKMMASVKADGYGHGAIAVSNTVLQAGADALGVASVEEALELRAAGLDAEILVYGVLSTGAAEAAISQDVTLTVCTRDDLKEVARAGRSLGRPGLVHLKVDTGMGRIGVMAGVAALDLLQYAASLPDVRLAGVFTHFSSADDGMLEEFPDFQEQQYRRFETVLEQARARGVRIPLVHAANSAALLRDSRYHYDMVRPGIALYGYHPAPQWRQDVDLQPVLTLHSRVVRIAEIPAGHGVSYGHTFVSDRMERIATLPIGYGDGVPRGLSNIGWVQIGDHFARIAGRICMDQMMVVVTGLPVSVGDEVAVYGSKASGKASVEGAAAVLDTIPYELLCRISDRVPRIEVRGRVHEESLH